MSAITLDEFRTITGMDEASLPRTTLIPKLAAATAIANRMSNRIFGHAIESIQTSGSDVVITVMRHGLPSSGKVYLSDTGAAGLTGAVSYTKIDADSIRVAGVTVASAIEGRGMLAVPNAITFEVASHMVRIKPSPVAAIEDVRIRDSNWEENGAFPSSTIVDPDYYLLASDGDVCWSGELEFSKSLNVSLTERRPGLIRPIKSRSRRIAKVNYYAGCVDQVPADLKEAIAAFTMAIAKDPMQDFASESYEYYSYSRLSAEEQRKLPTSAIATILRYRVM